MRMKGWREMMTASFRIPSARRFAVLVGLGLAGAGMAGGCGGAPPPPAESTPDLGSSAAPAPAPSSSAPSPPPSNESLAGIKAFDAGDYASARTSFEAAVKKNPKNYEVLLNLGLACEKLGDKTAAEAAYKKALEIKPDLENASTELSALYEDEGRTDDALAAATAGLSAHPDSAPLLENAGVALAAKGDQDGARQKLEQAAKVAASNPMFQLTLAHWLNAWHTKDAAAHLDAALNLAKDDYGLIASIGLEYRLAGEFPSCIKTFDRAVAIKDGGEVRTERALCHHGLKDDKATLDDLSAAVSIEPTYAPAHYYLGGRFAQAKQWKQAAAEYSKYLELAPNGSLAKPAAERLKASQDAARSGKKK
jgi:tetratricopeptide (TPR) repeat protein